jgi:hypothetical protein
MRSLISTFHDAAISPEAWPRALKALTEATGVAGAALIISNKNTGTVEEAYFYGLSAELQPDYIRHYAAVDPYSPLLDGSWKVLSESLPYPVLRKSEWYNDFVLTCGVRDILGARLVDTPSHCVVFGIHQRIGRSFSERVEPTVYLVNTALKRAAWHHVERLSSNIDAHHQSRTEALSKGIRFYFHIENGRRHPDEMGSVFPTLDEAASHALTIARELGEDRSWHGFSVLVTDCQGHEIVRVRIGS